jgi:hypothetical protein
MSPSGVRRDQALKEHELRLWRLEAQRLASPAKPQPDRLLAQICGLQAQEQSSAALGLRARSRGLTAAAVERSRDERSVVATWCMRGTLHLLAADDAGWLVGLLGPVFLPAARGRLAQLGLGADRADIAVRRVRDALARRGPLTRREIGELLARGRPRIDPKSQLVYHVVRRAALEGVLCGGPSRDGEQTYVLRADWIGSSAPRDVEVALAELARRYVAAFGPATPDDLAAWAGLPAGRAKTAWKLAADRLREVRAAGDRPAWVAQGSRKPRTRRAHPVVRLLPAYDNYLLGYRGRGLAVPSPWRHRVHPGGGLLRPTVVVDGRVIGVWRPESDSHGLAVATALFEQVDSALLRDLESEAKDVGRFLGARASLTLEPRGT